VKGKEQNELEGEEEERRGGMKRRNDEVGGGGEATRRRRGRLGVRKQMRMSERVGK
jgi:hypothetical protein